MRGVPSAPALITRDRVLHYAELDQAVGRLAAALLRRGAKAGDRVATWLPKTVEACLMPLAAARAGLIHVPINPQLRAAQADFILADSGATLILSSEERLSNLSSTIPARLSEEDAQSTANECDAMPPSSHDRADIAAILYTSGSTGMPKGVVLTHANMWLGAVSVAHYLQIRPEDRTLCLLPLSFDYGQNQLFNSWYAGAAAIPFDYLLPKDVVRAVDRYGATILAGVPPLWRQLLDIEWEGSTAKRLRCLTNSGGALTPALVARLRKTFPIAQLFPMYGLTEAFRSTYLDPALVDDYPTSIGKAIPFAEILIARADGTIADANETGELVHSGPLVAKGYWQDEERTAVRFKPAPAGSLYGGVAVWSGDKAWRDENGLHYFAGRDDEMIKVSGNRISPTEIESSAEKSGLVIESVAMGVPDERLGQSILLVAQTKNGTSPGDLASWFRRELPSFMVPAQIILRDELPRNPNGKLDRAALRAEFVQ